MNYHKLKQIAQPHIRQNDNLPSNAFLLLNQLHIPFRNEKQCIEDYSSKMSPLYNQPSFLAIDSKGEKTIYFNSNTKYWNFYIFHEISHYILGHLDDSPKNELEADMLACILAAPIENLPSNIKSARDLSVLCQIPIDKSEMYWQEIKNKFPSSLKKLFISGLLILILLLTTLIFFKRNEPVTATSSINTNINPIAKHSLETDNYYFSGAKKLPPDNFSLYMTPSGTRYHKYNCQYVTSNTNAISITLEEAETLNLEPCKKCMQ